MNCILIKKNCDLIHKKFNNELYKLCGLKNPEHFGLRFTWQYNNYYISLYSKSNGNAGNENKYDLPPPLDNKLYFGSIIIIAHKNQRPKMKNILNFTIDDWKKFYEYAFGGFENIEDESEEEEEKEEEIPLKFLTKTGYSKESGFIIDEDNENVAFLSDYSEEIMNDSDFYISDTENDDETEEDIDTEDDEDDDEEEEEEEEKNEEEKNEEEENEEEENEEEENEEEENDDEEHDDEEKNKMIIKTTSNIDIIINEIFDNNKT